MTFLIFYHRIAENYRNMTLYRIDQIYHEALWAFIIRFDHPNHILSPHYTQRTIPYFFNKYLQFIMKTCYFANILMFNVDSENPNS